MPEPQPEVPNEAQIEARIESQIQAQIQAIVQGKHRDPFSFLGPHGDVVRAWLPQAREALLVDCDDSVTPMRQGPTGFFTVTVPEPTRDYRFRITLYSGESVEIDDPYRFPPQLTPFDLHLHSEGSNYESYRTMGAHLLECEGVAGAIRGMGSQRGSGERHGRLQWLGSDAPSDAAAP